MLLRDVLRGEDAQIEAVLAQIALAAPDVIALQGIDYDLELRALTALRDRLAELGQSYAHDFAAPPNAGRMTDRDLDGDGEMGGAGDAQGYGRFFGQGSMALLSKYPVLQAEVEDYSGFLWRGLPGALLPEVDGAPFPSLEAQVIQRLPAHGAWVVPVQHPSFGRVSVMVYHASPPVFDGPEDRNGKRSHDETLFWLHLLDGRLGVRPAGPFVLLGDANLDPARGDGRRAAMQRLLAHPALQDPLPGQATVSFRNTGPLRVDYVLPSSDWTVVGAKVQPVDPNASRHSLVWVDLTR